VTSLTKLLSVSKVTSKKKKGRSKKAIELVVELERATDHFVKLGDQIANENEVIKNEMISAVQVVRETGNLMSQEARDFAEDPASTVNRGKIIRTSRALLLAVARLLILADMIDVHLLMSIVENMKQDIERLENVSNQLELEEGSFFIFPIIDFPILDRYNIRTDI
jgi:catenin alpha